MLTFIDENSYIFVTNSKLKINFGPYNLKYDEEEEEITRQAMKSWLTSNSPTLQNIKRVFTKIQNLFICGKFGITYDMTNKNTTVKEVIEAPEFKNFKALHVFGVKCTTKEMDYLMENIQADQDLHIQEGEIPEDYNHPNLFKFTGIHYCDSRWIHLEHLLSIKDNYIITLGKNNLSPTDINKFLMHWVNSENDLFTMFHIDRAQGVPLKLNELFNDLVVLRVIRKGCWCWLIAVKSPEFRTKQLLHLNWNRETIYMNAISINGKLKTRDSEEYQFAPEFHILKMLERKKSLTHELNDTKEILEINMELQKKGVYYDRGLPTVT
ncbi:hypothetical protein CRE_28887 [Caenorhabditis remanei]|uniref:Sdz-33 F-box domain-containing protein n=1 Tax=Caenorhabditis remanei TaxID=31234 RepID=E3MXC9_CAERE|nr:hypothetical protein CRE_28887 [Caenorhabditis remanei]